MRAQAYMALAALAGVLLQQHAVVLVHALDVKLKAMSFNIRTSHATEDRGAKCSNWDGIRKDNVLAQILQADPDFVGTQETSDEQKTFLDSALAEKYGSLGKSTGSLKGAAAEVDALYYKKTSWKMLSEGMFWLGPNPDAPSADWGMKYYRACVYGRFEHVDSGDAVCVLNTHFETPGNDLAQTKGADIILERLATVCQASDKVTVLLGDLNAKLEYPAVKKLLAGDLIEPSTEPTFCGDMMSPVCAEKFDYTLYRLSGGACHRLSQVVREDFDKCYPSDHAALITTFCVSGKCCRTDEGSASDRSAGSAAASNSSAGSGIYAAGTVNAPVVSADANASIRGSTPAPTKKKDGSKASTEVSTKSGGGSKATSTVVAIIGVIAAAGVIVAAVIHKKKKLEGRANQDKTYLVPVATFARDSDDSSRDSANLRLTSPAAILDSSDVAASPVNSCRSSISCRNSHDYQKQNFALL